MKNYPVGLIFRLLTNKNVYFCIAEVSERNGIFLYKTWSVSNDASRKDSFLGKSGGTLVLDERHVPKMSMSEGGAYSRLKSFLDSREIVPLLWLGGYVTLTGKGIYGGINPKWVDTTRLDDRQNEQLFYNHQKKKKKPQFDGDELFEVDGF